MLKAIETSYKGYRFRSRLEARWAVFFDALGIVWDYEPQGYDLGAAGWYLPDFWLPKLQAFVEIKPEHEYEAINKLTVLAEEHGCCVAHLFYGGFGIVDPKIESVCTDAGESAGTGHFETFWAICANCNQAYIDFDTDNALFLDSGFDQAYSPCPCGKPSLTVDWDAVRQDKSGTPWKLQAAFIAARSARFEHGEHP